MPTTSCGPFTFDGVLVTGPQPYFAVRGVEVLDTILAEQDPGFFANGSNGDIDADELARAVLARLDQHFRAWGGAG
jgi:hypothetical protein